MPEKLSNLMEGNLEKCRAAAIAAVDSYNRPGLKFRTAIYVVLIVLAWQAFFHAYFYKQKRKPWYRSRESTHKKPVRYEMVDGEPKHWELSKCLKEYFRNENPPERKNLEFLLGLRNKIEHRHLPQLDPSLYGECQAALLNLEDYLVRQFGDQHGLQDFLSLSLQFSRIRPDEQKKAIKSLARESGTVMEYIDAFRGSLGDDALNHPGYAYRVFLIPKIVNRENSADSAIEFVHFDKADPEQRATLRQMNALIKDKHIPIANLDVKRPVEVVTEVSLALPFVFNMHHHTIAWKYFEVRPKGDSGKPQHTDSSYCVYDYAHKDYLYTKAWIAKLISELSDPSRFEAIMGKPPRTK
ncbi:MAG: DUF3644 domain-containing protein [Candidatus Tectomicrobia bacterium]|nr:DUF3644 domain-containing protein [Candidatus Tectomicrobia bacterium]